MKELTKVVEERFRSKHNESVQLTAAQLRRCAEIADVNIDGFGFDKKWSPITMMQDKIRVLSERLKVLEDHLADEIENNADETEDNPKKPAAKKR